MSLTIQYDDLKLNISNAVLKIEGMETVTMKYFELSTGKLFISLRDFEGFMFLDKYNNFYDTTRRKIFFLNEYNFFEGDGDKEAFSLFENYKEFEKKIKDAKEEMKNNENEDKKNEIENKIIEELKNQLEKFDINKVILKNGKYYYDFPSDYDYIHDENYIESFEDNIKIGSDIFQEIKDNKIMIQSYGKFIHFSKYFKGEIFYNRGIGKRKYSNEENEKFCSCFPKKNELKEIENNDYNIIYKINDEDRLLLIESKKVVKNYIPVTIIVKDRYSNKNIIYQIEGKKEKGKDKLTGNGIVKDFRTGELLLVNFDTENIISYDALGDIPKFKDKEEFLMYKKSKKNDKYELIIDPTKEIKINTIDIKKEILNIDKYLMDIKNLKEKLYEKIKTKNCEYFGIKDQKQSGECWVYSLALLICLANARKYGRNLENFDYIYERIKNHFGCAGKSDVEVEKIMHFCKIFPDDENFDKEKYLNCEYNKGIPNFDLNYKKLDPNNDLEIKNYIKKGIKCRLSFNLNNLEWKNFSAYFKDNSIKPEEKILTLDILEKETKNFTEITGHAVILSDIDEEGNYICINSWGEDWGNKGTFKAKKECLKNPSIYAIYFYEEDLTEDERNAWIKLDEKIKKYLNEMTYIQCPICKRSAEINKYEIVERCKLKCPYEKKCVFDVCSDENKNLEFIAEQLMSYDPNMNIGPEEKFDIGFGL